MGLRSWAAMAATPLLCASGGVIPSEWKSTRRVYHVNERSAGPVPRNMDTADLRGDMYFEMHSLVLPLECQLAYRPFECENAEVVSPDLVVNELVLEVDARFGPYGRCNVCENGTDHHGDDHCADGSYVCNCGDSAAPEPCGARVGFGLPGHGAARRGAAVVHRGRGLRVLPGGAAAREHARQDTAAGAYVRARAPSERRQSRVSARRA